MEVVVRSRELKIIEDECVKLIGVMLTGVDQGVWDGLFDAGMNEGGEFDDFRACTENKIKIGII